MNTIILLSNTHVCAHANFWKDGSHCYIDVYEDDDHPAASLDKKWCQNPRGDIFYRYHVTPEVGNIFYKRLIARGWVRN